MIPARPSSSTASSHAPVSQPSSHTPARTKTPRFLRKDCARKEKRSSWKTTAKCSSLYVCPRVSSRTSRRPQHRLTQARLHGMCRTSTTCAIIWSIRGSRRRYAGWQWSEDGEKSWFWCSQKLHLLRVRKYFPILRAWVRRILSHMK